MFEKVILSEKQYTVSIISMNWIIKTHKKSFIKRSIKCKQILPKILNKITPSNLRIRDIQQETDLTHITTLV